MHQGRHDLLTPLPSRRARRLGRLAGAVLTGAVLAGGAAAGAGGAGGAGAGEDDPAGGPAVVHKSVSREDHPRTYRASVDYPQVEGLPDAGAVEAVNKEIEREVMVVLDAFTMRPHQRVDDHEVDSLVGRFETVRFDEGIAAFRLFLTEVPSGAVHGSTTALTVTFDSRTGRRYRLADLFRPGSAYLERLSDISRRMLAEHLDDPDEEWVEDGTAPREENFGGWAVADGALQVTFGEYQVAPYADGLPTILIPAGYLADIADHSGPLARS